MAERVCTQKGKRNKNLVDGEGGARTALDRAVREGWSEEKPIRGRVGEGPGLVGKPVKGPGAVPGRIVPDTAHP